MWRSVVFPLMPKGKIVGQLALLGCLVASSVLTLMSTRLALM